MGNINNTMLNTISSDKNGPQMEKLKINNRTILALTTVLIMGSAGMTVVYVLCVFILCMRNEETQTNDDRIELQHHLHRLQHEPRISHQESEPLIRIMQEAANNVMNRDTQS